MYSPIEVRVSAAGYSQWIPLNYIGIAFNVSVQVKLSSGASLTYSVEGTYDNLYTRYTDFTLSRTTTVATVTRTNHGLSLGDWSSVIGAGAPFDTTDLKVASVVDANNFTYTVTNSGLATGQPYAFLQWARVETNPILNGLTVSGTAAYTNPVQAVRLNVSSYSSGFADLIINQGRA